MSDGFSTRVVGWGEVVGAVHDIIPRTVEHCHPNTTLLKPHEVATSVLLNIVDKIFAVDVDATTQSEAVRFEQIGEVRLTFST